MSRAQALTRSSPTSNGSTPTHWPACWPATMRWFGPPEPAAVTRRGPTPSTVTPQSGRSTPTSRRRFVMVSYFGAGPNHGVSKDDPFFPYAEAKAAAEAHLRASRLDWTILGPARLPLEPATGRIVIGAGSEVSRADVALVVAAVLAIDSTIGRTIEFNNGETPIAEALAAELE